MELVRHTLEPVYDSASRVLILGTMPSPKSRELGFYYGHPQNRFWRALGTAMGEELPTDAEGKRAYLLRKHIALWDVLQSCEIEGASDSSIRAPQPNNIAKILAAAQITQVFTTGKTASRLYRKYCLPWAAMEDICLPSPSAANCALPFEALSEEYRAIARALDRQLAAAGECK